jgi:hypothetical protein
LTRVAWLSSIPGPKGAPGCWKILARVIEHEDPIEHLSVIGRPELLRVFGFKRADQFRSSIARIEPTRFDLAAADLVEMD